MYMFTKFSLQKSRAKFSAASEINIYKMQFCGNFFQKFHIVNREQILLQHENIF